MKVLLLTPYCLVPAHGGAEMATMETILSIQGRCELHLLAPIRKGDENLYQAHREKFYNTTIHRYDPELSNHVAGTPTLRHSVRRYHTLIRSLLTGKSRIGATMMIRVRELREVIKRI